MSKPSKKNLRPKKKMRWQMRDVTKKSATHKKTKGKSNRIVLAAALTLSLLTSSADDFSRRYEQWENAPLGIGVTACGYSTRGVYVRFETDLEPPFVVGVYRAAEEGLARRFPVAEVETSSKEAFIPGDFTFVTVFVQVMTKSVVDQYSADAVGHRVMTRSEWEHHVETIRNAVPFANTNANFSFEVPKDNVMDLVEDYTWCGFLKTTETNFCFTLAGRRAEPDVESVVTNVVQDVIFTNISTRVLANGDVDYVRTNSGSYASAYLGGDPSRTASSNAYAYGGCFLEDILRYPQHNDYEQVVTNFSKCNRHLVPHEYSFHIANGKNDVGTGYRIMVFEDSGVCQAQRAYSSRTNMSDAVVIPRGFRALTSHNGYIYTTDWEGRRYFQRVTNRVDHVIY